MGVSSKGWGRKLSKQLTPPKDNDEAKDKQEGNEKDSLSSDHEAGKEEPKLIAVKVRLGL